MPVAVPSVAILPAIRDSGRIETMAQEVPTLNTDTLFETHMHELRVFPPPAEFCGEGAVGKHGRV